MKRVRLELNNLAGNMVRLGTQSSAELQIIDDDFVQWGTLGFSASVYNFDEPADSDQYTARIAVIRTGGLSGTVTLDCKASPNTASKSDFEAVTQTLTFVESDSIEFCEVPIEADDAKEGVETINLLLENIQTEGIEEQYGGAVLGSQNEAQLFIDDDDKHREGIIRFGNRDAVYRVREGKQPDSKSNEAIITVKREGGSRGTVTVEWTLFEGTASVGKDYETEATEAMTRSGKITFPSGETSREFSIEILDDELSEGTETAFIVLNNPTNGAKLGTQSMAVLNIYDDEPVSVQFDAEEYYVYGPSETAYITVTLEPMHELVSTLQQTITVRFTGEWSGNKYSDIAGELRFAPGEPLYQNFVIQVPADKQDYADTTIELHLEELRAISKDPEQPAPKLGAPSVATVNFDRPPRDVILSNIWSDRSVIDLQNNDVITTQQSLITAQVLDRHTGQPLEERSVTFETSKGNLDTQTAQTDAHGRVTTILTSDGTYGTAIVTATVETDDVDENTTTTQEVSSWSRKSLQVRILAPEVVYLPVVSNGEAEPACMYLTTDKRELPMGEEATVIAVGEGVNEQTTFHRVDGDELASEITYENDEARIGVRCQEVGERIEVLAATGRRARHKRSLSIVCRGYQARLT